MAGIIGLGHAPFVHSGLLGLTWRKLKSFKRSIKHHLQKVDKIPRVLRKELWSK